MDRCLPACLKTTGLSWGGSGGVLPEKLGGVCSPFSNTRILFMTEIFDIPNPIHVTQP